MPWIAAGIAALGAVSALSKKKDNAAQSQSGFAALPEQVQQVYLQKYLPAVQDQFNKTYQAPPMKRVNNLTGRGDPFASQGLAELQRYSDAVGGMFMPTNRKPADRNILTSSVDDQVRAKYGMSLADFLTQKRPDVMAALAGGDEKFNAAWGTGKPNSSAAVNWWNTFGSKGM